MTESIASPLQQRRILRTEIPGPRSLDLHSRRRSAVSDGLGIVAPVFVERAEGAILLDVDGNQIIDLASGIAVTSVGASAPEVAAAVAEQVTKFTHTCFMVTEYEPFVAVCEKLNALTPGDHEKRTALFTSGAEAIENAVKIARTATGRDAVVVLDHAYHGRTLMTMSMTAKNVPYKEGFGPFAPEVYRVPMAYPFRHGGTPKECLDDTVARIEEIITSQIGPSNIAALVVEPIQGEGGFVTPPDGFLGALRELTTKYGILLVADEIQTGFGRTGDLFACEHEGVVPDIICTAKALAGGLPLSAVTGRAEIMNAVGPGSIGGTYAGNPAACVAALAAIDIIERDGLVQRAREIEERVMPRLAKLVESTDIVGDARGRGAMLAIEFVEPGTTVPAPDLCRAVAAACHKQGVLALTAGTFGNVIRLLPPLVIDPELLDDALDVLEQAVTDVASSS